MLNKRKVATMKEVAEAAGVSTMTVSAVLGRGTAHSSRVSDTTRERVLETALRINYFPSAFAQGMRKRRINALGVVLFHPDARLTGDPNVCGLLDGIFAVANERGQNTTVFTGQRWSDAARSLPVFCDGRTDGLIILWPAAKSDMISALLRVEVPFVMINGCSDDLRVTNVKIDDVAAMQALVEHLVEQGHRRIAYFSGPSVSRAKKDRYEGYCRALSAVGEPCDPQLLILGAYSEASGYERARVLLSQVKIGQAPAPTAICCESDHIAQGVLQAFREADIRVPEQISVTGFDDIPDAVRMSPPLTTVHQSFDSLGRRGAELLLDTIDAGTYLGGEDILPTSVVLRGSVAPPCFGPL